MTTSLHELFPAGYRALAALERANHEGPIPGTTLELLKMRASQLNGCAYCLDMHYKDARAAGESEERLSLLAAWREATVYSAEERAALALTEAVTRIGDAHVPAEVEEEVRRHYDETGFAALVFAVVAINAWNRVAISGHSEPGHYQPAAAATS